MRNEIPNNYEELKKKSRNKKSWRQRLEAVNELKEYDSKQSRDIILNLALHDEVFIVKENAFRAAQAMEITKNGKPIKL
ncbi:TPA: HEAT repeat domain-containing protein, partial [Salmonella enterica]|nr:HEAT repeat domain-containing protein [Salmonella enterica]